MAAKRERKTFLNMLAYHDVHRLTRLPLGTISECVTPASQNSYILKSTPYFTHVAVFGRVILAN